MILEARRNGYRIFFCSDDVPISPTFHISEIHFNDQWWRLLAPASMPIHHLREELRAQAHHLYFTRILTQYTRPQELCFRLGRSQARYLPPQRITPAYKEALALLPR